MLRYFLGVFLLVFNANQCCADVLKNFDITARMQETYASINNFSADITQVLTHAESQTSEHRTGKLAFKKPEFINIETVVTDGSQKKDLSRIIVSNDVVWVYVPEEEAAYKYSRDMLKEVSPSLLVLTGQANLLENFSIEEQKIEASLTKLTLFPNEPTTQMVKLTIWVETNTGLLHRAIITDFYENTNDITLIDLKLNGTLQDSLFQFNPPEDVFIEDHMEQ